MLDYVVIIYKIVIFIYNGFIKLGGIILGGIRWLIGILRSLMGSFL